MKTKIHGYEIECTMDEFIQFLEQGGKIAAPPQIKTTEVSIFKDGVYSINDSEIETTPKRVMVQMPGKEPIICPSIRSAMKEAGLGYFKLDKYFRNKSNQVMKDGVLFTLLGGEDEGEVHKAEVKIPEPPKDKPKKKKAAKPRKGERKFCIIYPDGDHRLIQLKPFCLENDIPYSNALKKLYYNEEFEYNGIKIKRIDKK